MALKPTIFKMNINVSDLDNDIYESINLTVAQHPSENTERMMARVMAFIYNNQEFLTFTKGLSVADDPDIWAKSLADEFLLWIDVGEPAFERIKKASRLAQQTKVYSFNSKAGVWWKQSQAKFSELDVEVYQFEFEQIQALAKLVQRSMDFSVTITDGISYVAAELGDCEVTCTALQNKQ
ncbi:YaeQ family protein [Psychromonas ossibalaenae]|uniref:YaeQ family protein n=1 Tax=Psychromonas ossibalaenae TaxID=444922 RepID=UPI0003814F6C|nr:YaeQ family protein [Psychromonas ossibalaenae]